MRDVSSAFWLRLQGDNIEMAELIDLTLPNSYVYRWTTANEEVTWAGNKYIPFPGQPGSGIEESIDLGVNVIEFTIANSGTQLKQQLLSSDFALAGIDIGQCFTDTPDLGRMSIYKGKVGDFGYNRAEISGQARNIWKSLNVKWPYYTYNEKCVLRFGSFACGFNTTSVTQHISSINVGSSTTLELLVQSGTLVNSFPAGRFNFGRATITGGVNSGAIRTIRNHSGDLLMLSHPLPNPDLSGMTLDIFPGCQKRLLEDCHSLYNNSKNFLGWPWIPIEEDAF